jgi:uncharacterized protein YwgA
MRYLDEMRLARVIDACGGIDGRVKMQKIVYLLKAMGYDLPFDDFVIRQQGPFSAAVACCADILSGAGFVTEERQELGQNELGEAVVQYSYSLRAELAPLVRQHFELCAPQGKPPLPEIAAELKSRDRKTLEVAATRLYLQREEQMIGEPLEHELRRLKGHLQGSFKEADELLAGLRARQLL